LFEVHSLGCYLMILPSGLGLNVFWSPQIGKLGSLPRKGFPTYVRITFQSFLIVVML
jgi:hypothetical protein